MRTRLALVLFAAGCAAGPDRPIRTMGLRRVILYQNGIGYFERAGHLKGGELRLAFGRGELDDVLKTLTVIDRIGGAGVATVDVPAPTKGDTIALGVRLASRRAHDLVVGYAVPTPTWKAAYRVVMDDGKPGALLQGWAMINNTSQEDWEGVDLTLATGAPMSFAQDLHTPQFVARPDTTGHLVTPTVLGPIGGETANARTDSDGDGIVDQDDRCPDEPEARNGFEDDDGCPDRGRVIVSDTSIQILERVQFAKGSDALTAGSRQIIAAVVATLKANPDIARVEIQGHASDDEADAWVLSSKRAEAVRAAVVAGGIDGRRLQTLGYAATQPLSGKPEQNRRVEWLILERGDDEHAPAQMHVDRTSAQASTRTTAVATPVAGTVRFALGEPVTIKRGGSTMVSILNKPIDGEDALLFRPDPNAPGSDRHPFRAVRLVNSSGFTLEPGPVAIFAGGSFVGDSLLERLDLGQTSWIPYALDGGTQVVVEAATAERPGRLLAMARGVLTVENAGVKTTTYRVAAGLETAKVLYIRHTRSAGYTAVGLPPGAIDRGDTYLIPLPLTAGKASTLSVEEREPRRRTVALLDANKTDLGVYLDAAKLPPDVAAKIEEAIAVRRDLGAAEEELASLRAKIADANEHTAEIRENLRTLDKVRTAGELKNKLIASLTAAVGDADALAKQVAMKSADVAAARDKLQRAIRGLSFDPAKTASAAP